MVEALKSLFELCRLCAELQITSSVMLLLWNEVLALWWTFLWDTTLILQTRLSILEN
jgi:hypothetical protein